MEYAISHPLQPPLELFEGLSIPAFVLLSFGAVRQSPTSVRSYVVPNLIERLRSEAELDHIFLSHRVVLLSLEKSKISPQRSFPVYAIPASLIQLPKEKKVNHSRQHPLVLLEGHALEDYRFDDLKCFLKFVHSQQEVSSDRQFSYITIKGIRVMLISRSQLFVDISEKWRVWDA